MAKTGKKSLALLLAALMLFSITPLNGLGELLATKVSAAKQGDYTYEVIDSEVTILDVKSSITGDVVIPATFPLNGVDYPVTRIGYRAFDFCNQITSVTFPEGVTVIGGSAFQGCSALKTVTLPESLEAIGGNAFASCNVLEGVTIPGNVTEIGESAFSSCHALTDIVIPDSVTKIGNQAFSLCQGLTGVLIGKGVKDLGRVVFRGCGALPEITVDSENPYFLSEDGVLFNKDKTLLVCYPTAKADLSYTVPTGVTSVGYGAFTEARFLENVTISDSVTDIETGAFASCYSLETLNLGEGVKNIGYYAFGTCFGLTNIEIPDSVITIGEQAFYYCGFATNLTLGEGVTNIGDEAFSGCSLTSVTLPKSVTNLGEAVFGECYDLTEILADPENPNYSNDENGILFSKDKSKLVAYPSGKAETNYTVPQGVTEIGEYSFYSDSVLTDIIVSDSVTVIGEGAFYYSNIENVTIGTGVTLIDDEAFYGCNSLTGITVPDNVKTIGDYAFDYCRYLANVDLGSGVTSIGDEAFYGCDSLTAITIPHSVTHLGESVFYSCDALESAVIGDGVTLIDEMTFYYCEALENVTIGSGVTTIGEYAFHDCDSLTGIVIPDSVTVIDSCAFQDCDALATVTIGNGVTHIGDDAFGDCDVLTTVTFGNSLTYIGEDAFEWCGQLGEINIPEGVTYIGDWAFYWCEALATITLPDSLDYIGSSAFGWTDYYNETGNWENGVLYIGNHLIDTFSDNMVTTDYVIRDGTITIAQWALAECDLTSLTIPDSVENLCDYALSGNGFTEINFSSNLLTIGNGALADCDLLETITVDGNNPNYMVEEGVLFDKDQTLLVAFPPADTRETYDIPGTVKTVGYCAFSCCDTLTQVTIPEGVTEIRPWAFQYCLDLADVTIPETVEEIGEGAFYACRSFIDMEIPKGIAYIGYSTFEECAFLERVSIPITVFVIDGGAFDYCSSLTDVYYEGKVRNWDSINLGYSSDLRNAHIHCEGVEAGYKLRDGLFWFFVDAQGNAIVTGFADYPGTNVEIPATCSDSEGEYPVIGIGVEAFYGMDFIKSITIPKSITFIEKYAFEYCNGIRDVYYKGTEAQWNAIEIMEEGNEDLLDADIHFLGEEEEEDEFTYGPYTYTVDENGNATIIDVDEAINGDVEIPETLGGCPVTEIGDGAFSNCNSITQLTVPDSITTIGANAFAGCGGFTDVYYQGTRAQWNAVIGTEALAGKTVHCTDDEEEGDEFTNGFYTYTLDENGNATIIDVDEAINGDVEIPETLDGYPVTGIGDGAFSNCNLITQLTIPDSITTIGANAFAGCGGFTDVYYQGTRAQWNAVTGTEALDGKEIHCTDDPDDPDDPGDDPEIPDDGDYTRAKFSPAGFITVKYKNKVTVRITATGLPATGFLVVDGAKVAPDATGRAVFEETYSAKEPRVFKAHIEDANGNIKKAEKEYEINVKTGFFDKLISFFKDFLFNGFKWREKLVEF